MSSDHRRPSLSCVSCDGNIVGRAEFYAGLPFCCAGCVVGGPCMCSYDLEPVDADPAETFVRAFNEAVLV